MIDGRRLEAALAEALGVAVEILERRPGAYPSSFAVEEIDMLAGRELLPLFVKDVGPAGLTEEGRRAKPDFLLEPRREREAYDSLLPGGVPEAPRLHAVVDDEAEGHCWLVLERIVGTPLHESGDFEQWLEAARWLARMHARCADLRGEHLLRYDASLYELWLARAVAFNAAEDVRWLEAIYPDAAARLEARPQVFLHGEFSASNVLVEQGRGGMRIRPVDWEMAAVGPALLDLAALTAGRWRDEERDELAAAYLAEAGAGGRLETSFQQVLECCRLHLAVQWLGWSQDWTPPPEHAIFWLGEAARAAERLGL